MNYNILAYSIYLGICFFITLWVGRDLHKNGHYLIYDLFKHKGFTKTVNNILLVAYYLVNLGYIATTLASFGQINSFSVLMETIASHVGSILLILSALHFNNILILHLLSKRKYKIILFFNP